MFMRHPQNPLITPGQVRPSREGYQVIGTFNAGAALHQGEVVLLMRVAERPIEPDPDLVAFPLMSSDGQVLVQRLSRKDERYDTSDPRLVIVRATGDILLTSISHIRMARSSDGVHFRIEDTPWLTPQPPYENYGVEDARVTQIGEIYYVNYSTVSVLGVGTGLARTTDFEHIERLGVMFAPPNRDVTIFPEKVNGQYVCYHRPMPSGIGRLNIWYAASPDLRHWGDHRIVLTPQGGAWEAGRIGGGAPPIRTQAGWLSIYHAADEQQRYCLGAFLTPIDEPWRVIQRSMEPILSPVVPYETGGFFPNVVFTCGAILSDGLVRVYYGASDDVIALAETPLESILESLKDI